MSKEFRHRYVISVLLPDRVGILRDISTAMTDLGANIDGISQTVVADYFTVIMTASFKKQHNAAELQAAILEHFHDSEASVSVRPYTPSSRPRTAARKGSRYIVTIAGKDRPGLLKTLTSFLASRHINVEDWYVEFCGDNVTHIGEVSVPENLDIKHVQNELSCIMAGIGIMCSLQHENIFRVTNEVGAVSSMLGDQLND